MTASMQSLQHQALRLRCLSGWFTRALSTESLNSKPRKSKEEKYGLAMQFIERFKASNDGKLPGITALRKEVGGSYDVLKEILESIKKENVSRTASSDIIENKPESTGMEKDLKEEKVKKRDPDHVLKSPLTEASKKSTETEALSISSTRKSKANVPAKKNNKNTTRSSKIEAHPLVSNGKSASQCVTIDSDDDSDVAAPEYTLANQTVKVLNATNVQDVKDKVGFPSASARALSDKEKNIKNVNGHASQKPRQTMGIQKGTGAGHEVVMDTYRLPTVFRLSNLPLQASKESVRTLCETIANVHDLEMRKKGIADVQFNIRNDSQVENVLDRLRNATLDKRNLKANIAPRFYCGEKPEGLRVDDAHRLKEMRESAFTYLEHCFKQLHARVQDYRELLAMKRNI